MKYPNSLMEVVRLFSTEEDCLDYLFKLRWPEGYSCPNCENEKSWKRADGVLECCNCRCKISIKSGTTFESSHISLVLWFRAAWWIACQENGASARGLQRLLGLGSYQTAWTWLHKLRHAMMRPGRDRLDGTIQVDEARYRATSLVLVLVQEKGFETGRIRLHCIPNAEPETLSAAMTELVVPGSRIKTDGWHGYKGLTSLGFDHEPVRESAAVGCNLLPLCEMEFQNVMCWLNGTHRGGVGPRYLQGYLNEYTFRFNRRNWEHRGLSFQSLLQNAVATAPYPGKNSDTRGFPP